MYRTAIADAIGTTDPATITLVEEIMRTNRSGLDDLSPRQLADLARQANADMHLMANAGELVGYCDTLGMQVPGRFLN